MNILNTYHPIIYSIKSGDSSILLNSLKEFGYNPLFYLDENKKYDPFNFVIDHNDSEMILK